MNYKRKYGKIIIQQVNITKSKDDKIQLSKYSVQRRKFGGVIVLGESFRKGTYIRSEAMVFCTSIATKKNET